MTKTRPVFSYYDVLDEVVDVVRSRCIIESCQFDSCVHYEEDWNGVRYFHSQLLTKDFKTVMGAIGAYSELLYDFLNDRQGMLLWRERPVLIYGDYGWFVRSRQTLIPKDSILVQYRKTSE